MLGGLALVGLGNSLAGPGFCPDADLAPRPRSYFSADNAELASYQRNRFAVERAVVCLINAERGAQSPPVSPVRRYVGLRGSSIKTLSPIVQRHADAAASLQWWGTVAEFKRTTGIDCVPYPNDPSRCDPHTNPQTRSTPASRLAEGGFCASPRTLLAQGEIAFTGAGVASDSSFQPFSAGDQLSTPQAAVRWWMWSDGHRAILLEPRYKEVGIGMAPVAAYPGAGAFTPAGTYVAQFANCAG